MEVRGRHQGNEPAHRVEADPAERPIPVDGRKLGDGVGVQDVDGRAERPSVHGGRLVHGDSRLRARVFSIPACRRTAPRRLNRFSRTRFRIPVTHRIPLWPDGSSPDAASGPLPYCSTRRTPWAPPSAAPCSTQASRCGARRLSCWLSGRARRGCPRAAREDGCDLWNRLGSGRLGVGRLTEAATRQALQEPLRRHDVHITEDGLGKVRRGMSTLPLLRPALGRSALATAADDRRDDADRWPR